MVEAGRVGVGVRVGGFTPNRVGEGGRVRGYSIRVV